jgi:two-component system chemotaxis sensor kinase CheA
MLLVTGFVGIATLILVAILNTQSSSQYLATVRVHIEEGIRSKGRVLTENHALAMRSLVLDNAYLDMQRLVERAVKEDSDLVYGIYVSNEKQAMAYCQRGVPCGGEKIIDKDVWRPLGLKESELIVDKLRIESVHRLGDELLEVAMPVVGEEREPVGTIRYGLSTRRMQVALSAAKADANKRLQRSLLLIGAIVGISTLVGLLLSRVQAVRITRPVTDLTKAAQEIASGNRAVRVAINSGDELEVLGGSFNKMVEDLDASYSQLEEMNRTLEQKVQTRTAELATKNRDMRLVLDNVDQGFITLSSEGIMASERSKVVDDWFGASDSVTTFSEFIAPHSRTFALEFQMAWDQVKDGFLPIEVTIEQLPAHLVLPHKTFSIRYLPFLRDQELDGVLIVIADITEKLLKEREEAEQSELMQGFKRLMLDRSGFSAFLRDASGMIEQIRHPENLSLVILKRTIHTLKGNSAVMGLVVVARLCHTLEDQIAETGKMSSETLEELVARWNAISEHIATFAGTDKQRVIEIPQTEYAALVSRLSVDTHGELLNQLLAWQLEPVTKPFERLAEQARALASRLGKGELNVVIEGGGVRLDPDSWSPFFANLIHAVRNAIDHGIEEPEVREKLGKPRYGTVLFKAIKGANSFTLEIGDDGRGIDWEALAIRAKSKGLPASTHQQLVDALMTDGVSTKSEVSDVSGRGVGMGALMQRIVDMEGTIDVRSTRNKGTTWLIRFPWNPTAIPTVRMRRSVAPPKRLSNSPNKP